MSSVFDTTGVQPLILELLGRRNRFEPKQLEELGEQLGKAGPGTIPEAFLIKGGYSRIRRSPTSMPRTCSFPSRLREPRHRDRQGTGRPLAREALHRQADLPDGLRDDVLDVAFVSPETMGVVDELQLLTGLRINPLIGPFPWWKRNLTRSTAPIVKTRPLAREARISRTRRSARRAGREHPQPRHSATQR